MIMSQRNHPKMNRDFFASLPSEIIIDILSRLPIRTIIYCKCVCKSWLELVDAHLSKGVPCLTVHGYMSYKIYDFEDGLDIEHHDLHKNLVIEFELGYDAQIYGSATGLLLLNDVRIKPHALCICNPITNDYINLQGPREFVNDDKDLVNYGFGVSKITGQHKVVRIFQNKLRFSSGMEVPNAECVCHVYTLGTGLWRRVAGEASLVYDWRRSGAFLNGNLHWLVSRAKDSQLLISWLDLETELFSTFSPPPPPLMRNCSRYENGLFALGDYLSLTDNTSDDEIVIWLMKKYGVEKSWAKEYVIAKDPDVFRKRPDEYINGVVYPIKVFKNGDILMALEYSAVFYYSKKKNSTQKFGWFDWHFNMKAYLFTPSLLSLRSFELENVCSSDSLRFICMW